MSSSEGAQKSKAVVKRILAGDKTAEEDMINMYQQGLHTVLRGKIYKGNESVLDDVIQETWRVVIEKVRANELEEHEKLAQFIVRVGINQLRMFGRKYRDREEQDNDILDSVGDDDADPSGFLEKIKLAELIRKKIDELKQPRDRELLKSYYLDEQSKESLCRRHGLDEKHLSRVLFRARNRFKALWDKD